MRHFCVKFYVGISVLILISHVSHAGGVASLSDFLKSVSCANDVAALAKKWNAHGDWQDEFRSDLSSKIIKSPTNKIGIWVFLEKGDRKSVIAHRYSPHTELTVSWNPKSCEQKIDSIQAIKSSDLTAKENTFDDVQLQKLLDRKKNGLIYVYSDSMHLSIDGIRTIQEVAKDLDLELTLLSSESSKLHKNQTLASKELLFRGIANHFPSLIMYSRTGSLSGVYPGLKSKESYSEFIRERLK